MKGWLSARSKGRLVQEQWLPFAGTAVGKSLRIEVLYKLNPIGIGVASTAKALVITFLPCTSVPTSATYYTANLCLVWPLHGTELRIYAGLLFLSRFLLCYF